MRNNTHRSAHTLIITLNDETSQQDAPNPL